MRVAHDNLNDLANNGGLCRVRRDQPRLWARGLEVLENGDRLRQSDLNILKSE
jgi:hypothetical protein